MKFGLKLGQFANRKALKLPWPSEIYRQILRPGFAIFRGGRYRALQFRKGILFTTLCAYKSWARVARVLNASCISLPGSARVNNRFPTQLVMSRTRGVSALLPNPSEWPASVEKKKKKKNPQRRKTHSRGQGDGSRRWKAPTKLSRKWPTDFNLPQSAQPKARLYGDIIRKKLGAR